MAKDVIADLEARFSTNMTDFSAQVKSMSGTLQSETVKMNQQLARNEAVLKQNQKELKGFGDSISSVVKIASIAAGATGIGMFISKQLDLASTLVDSADKIGVSTNALQEYRYIAEQSGVSTQSLDDGLTKFSKSMGELKEKAGPLYSELNKFDKSMIKQLESATNTSQALDIYLKYLAGIDGQSEKLVLSVAAFGKSAGPDLTNMLSQGVVGLEAQKKAYQDLGISLDENMLRKMEETGDKVDTLKTILGNLAIVIVGEMAPALATAGDYWIKFLTEVKKSEKPFDVVFDDLSGISVGVEKTVSGAERLAAVMHSLPKDFSESIDEVRNTINNNPIDPKLSPDIHEEWKNGVLYAWNDAAKEVHDSPVKPQLDFDYLKEQLKTLEDEIKALEKEKALDIQIGADTKEVDRKLQEKGEEIKNIKWAIALEPKTESIDDYKKRLQKELQAISNDKIPIFLELDEAKEQTDDFVDYIDSQDPAITVSVDTTEGEKQIDEFAKYVEERYKKMHDEIWNSFNDLDEEEQDKGSQGGTPKKYDPKSGYYYDASGWFSFVEGVLMRAVGPGYAPPKFHSGTGLSGLPYTGLFVGQKDEIVLNVEDSKYLNSILSGVSDPTKNLREMIIAGQNSRREAITKNVINRSNNINIVGTGIGGRPFISAQEAAADIVRELNRLAIANG